MQLKSNLLWLVVKAKGWEKKKHGKMKERRR